MSVEKSGANVDRLETGFSGKGLYEGIHEDNHRKVRHYSNSVVQALSISGFFAARMVRNMGTISMTWQNRPANKGEFLYNAVSYG